MENQNNQEANGPEHQMQIPRFLTERRYSILDFAAFMGVIYIASIIAGMLIGIFL